MLAGYIYGANDDACELPQMNQSVRRSVLKWPAELLMAWFSGGLGYSAGDRQARLEDRCRHQTTTGTVVQSTGMTRRMSS